MRKKESKIWPGVRSLIYGPFWGSFVGNLKNFMLWLQATTSIPSMLHFHGPQSKTIPLSKKKFKQKGKPGWKNSFVEHRVNHKISSISKSKSWKQKRGNAIKITNKTQIWRKNCKLKYQNAVTVYFENGWMRFVHWFYIFLLSRSWFNAI